MSSKSARSVDQPSILPRTRRHAVVGATLRPPPCSTSRSSRSHAYGSKLSRRSTMPVTSAMIRRITSSSDRVATRTCGNLANGAEGAATDRIEHEELRLQWRRGEAEGW